MKILYCFLTGGIIIAASISIVQGEAMPMCSSNSFRLKTEQIRQIKSNALNGDPDASFKLYQHYSFGLNDIQKSKKWLLLAVALNSSLAKQHLGVLSFKNDFSPKNAFYLSDNEIKKMKEDMDNGSGESAFWLCLYYRFCTDDKEAAEKCCKKAIALNIKAAEKELKFINAAEAK